MLIQREVCEIVADLYLDEKEKMVVSNSRSHAWISMESHHHFLDLF